MSGGKDLEQRPELQGTAEEQSSEPSLDRRDFLKIAGVGAGIAAASCEPAPRNIYPYIVPPRNQAVGESAYYATVCRECPAGCGVHARVREGRPVKLEGNPAHPICRGSLCGRGQAGLLRTYGPERLRGPARRGDDGLEPVRWDEAVREVGRALRAASERGRGRVVVWSGLETGSLAGLMSRLATSMGGEHLMFDPQVPEPLLEAHRLAFGRADLSRFDLDEADLVIALEADLFETYPSTVELSRQVVGLDRRNGRRANLVWVGPRRGVTGLLADHWVPARAGSSGLLALALLGQLAAGGGQVARVVSSIEGLPALLEANPPATLARRAGVAEEDLEALAERIDRARRPVVMPPSALAVGPYGMAGHGAVVLLDYVLGAYNRQLVFGPTSALSRSARAGEIRAVVDRMAAGEVDVLVVVGANPLFDLPGGLDLEAALGRVDKVVAIADRMNATAEHADLVLAASSPLESWGDYEPRAGIIGLLQPTMEPIFDTRMVGDQLIGMASHARAANQVAPGARSFEDHLRARWAEAEGLGGRAATEAFSQAQRRGGLYEEAPIERVSLDPALVAAVGEGLRAAPEPDGDAVVIAPYAPIGSGLAERSSGGWLDELPEPTTAAVWGSPAEVHPDVASRLGIEQGGTIRLVAEGREPVELAVAIRDSVRADTIAVPLDGGSLRRGSSPARLLGASALADGSGVVRSGLVVTPSRGAGAPFHVETRQMTQHRRGLARAQGIEDHRHHLHYESRGGLYEEQHHTDMYGPRQFEGSRWGMVIDLDLCTGCGACIVACYAENNVSVVGAEQADYGREMAWLQLHVYWEQDHAGRPIPLSIPVLCQHCHQAPCESVCPVYAPYQTPEGINGQVYNRCVGTRFCANNCPYKVRRFNWLGWPRPWPLPLQLNPDVTARSEGVMEKCTFCHQRIRAAQEEARLDGDRQLHDGDIVPACQQTCPTGALVFGDLADPESRVSRLARDERGYHLLGQVGTRPAITYLERVVRWR